MSDPMLVLKTLIFINQRLMDKMDFVKANQKSNSKELWMAVGAIDELRDFSEFLTSISKEQEHDDIQNNKRH